MPILARKHLIATALALGAAGSLAMASMTASPARAQITVFGPEDPSEFLKGETP